MPHQFYYAVPYALKDKALAQLDQWKKEGLLCGDTGLLAVIEKKRIGYKDVIVVRRAPVNKSAKKLTIKEMIIMARNQSGTICSLMCSAAKSQYQNQDMGIDYCI